MDVMKRIKQVAKSALKQLGLYQQLRRESRALAELQLDHDFKAAPSTAKVALIGCGNRGLQVANAVRQFLPTWRITHLIDQRSESIDRVHRLFPEATSSASTEELIAKDADFDMAIVATTAPSHFDICMRLMHSGTKRIFLEKPLTNSLAQADELIELSTKLQCRVAVDHTRRYVASIPNLKRILSRRAIGDPRSIHFLFGRAGFAMIGSHLFDIARNLFEEEIVRIRAQLDEEVAPTRRGDEFIDQGGRCEAVTESGRRIAIDLSYDLPLQQFYFVVMGEHGRLEVDEKLGKARLVGTGGRNWDVDYTWPGANHLGVARALHELQSDGPITCTLQSGRAAVEAVIACHASQREHGKWISVPLQGPIRAETFPFA